MADDADIDIVVEEQHREFLLQSLRNATLRAKLMDGELQSIGIALKGRMIDNETAVRWLMNAGLLWMIELPAEIGRVAKSNDQPTERKDASAETRPDTRGGDVKAGDGGGSQARGNAGADRVRQDGAGG
jgi:hypothetical protein